jgi:NADH dehydrogenase [ubiquinone] 1 alpha subcomplex assembly factor 5
MPYLAQVRDAGSLLSEAEFTLQTVDVDDITVQYNDVGECISHLRVRCS